MVTTDFCTDSSTSLNHISIGVSNKKGGREATAISSFNSFISIGSDLGRRHLTLVSSLLVQDIHGSHHIQEDTKAQLSHSFFEQGLCTNSQIRGSDVKL
ncbi:hypothetical protein TNCT_136271 [Trichonephila clavata]|uniref:Uncharacterized protein n=1 Tax=Trichonephila clavata TaxID=2740835 RepID=A0A8X6GC67_TRICU|nr:hypothetical protein TNCT_136271 [Trichonephila clavata]